MNKIYINHTKVHVDKFINGSILFEKLLIAFLPLVLISSYFSGIPRESVAVLGIILLWFIALFHLCNYSIILDKKRALLLLIIALYLLLGTIPGFNSISPVLLLRDLLRYGAVLLALVFGAGDAIRKSFQTFVNMTIIIVLALSVLGFIALFIGSYTIGPLVVSLYYPLRVGSLAILTTSSLIRNTNYYAITLVISYAMLKFYGVSFLSRESKVRYGLEIMLIAAIILTKSRIGVVLVLLILSVQFLRWLNELPARRKGFLLIIFLISMGIAGLIRVIHIGSGLFSTPIFKAFVVIERDFFLEKGLNLRDVLWAYGLEIFYEHPLGIGFGGVSETLAAAGAPTTTVQNMFLTYMLFGGVPLFSLVIVVVLMAFANYLCVYRRMRRTARRAELSQFVKSMLAVCLIVLIDGMARVYILGGIGFIPFMFSFAILGGIGWVNGR